MPDELGNLCECGCDDYAGLYKGSAGKHIKKGAPRRFIPGHHMRRKRELREVPGRLDTPCLIGPWTPIPPWGYCRLGVGGGRMVGAHRYYYEQAKGPIPEGLVIDHLCGFPRCVNPDHLEAVTQSMNLVRGLQGKLTTDDVAAIRASVGVTHTELARQYGVVQSTISRIRSYQRRRAEPYPT